MEDSQGDAGEKHGPRDKSGHQLENSQVHSHSQRTQQFRQHVGELLRHAHTCPHMYVQWQTQEFGALGHTHVPRHRKWTQNLTQGALLQTG